MHPHAQVYLGDGAEAVGLRNREQQTELDAVAGEERHGFQHPAPTGILAGERLHQARQLREE